MGNTLKDFNTSNSAIVSRIKEVEKSYTPAVVKNAVHDSQAVLSDLKDQINNLFDRLARFESGLLLKIALRTLVVAFALTAATWLALQAIPTLSEITDRRATIQTLQEQIGPLRQQLELKGRLVFSGGQWYARTDNSTPVNICDPGHPEICGGPYVPVR